MTYEEVYNKSIAQPADFWLNEAQNVDWFNVPTLAFKNENDGTQSWFPDGKTNLSYLCIDQHINNGYGEETAIIYDSAVSNKKVKFTYTEVHKNVGRLAGGLKSLGVSKGDTVIIYMPMIPEAIFSMLACTRIGAIHSVVFGGFAPNELALRIDDAQPKAIISATAGIEVDKIVPYQPMLESAIKKSNFKPEHVIIYDRKLESNETVKNDYLDYEALLEKSPLVEPVPLKSTDASYILYTSGTTGKPKGVVRDTGGYAVALQYSMKNIYGVKPGDVFWAASDVGWVVGHSYIVYAPMMYRASTVIYEGKPIRTPDAGAFWRVISDHKVSVMFTAPTAFRAIRKEDPTGELLKKHDISSLRYQFLAGERCDESTLDWLKKILDIPIIDHWWQTETGWPIVANFMGLEVQNIKPGSAGKAVSGYSIEVLNEEGVSLAKGEEGYICIKLPMPPGFATTLWNNNKRFIKSYFSRFKGFYFSGDGGYIDEQHNVFITGRIDDVINVAGHRLSTASMEEVIASHPSVADCAVIGRNDELKGEIPLALVVVKPKTEIALLTSEIVKKVRETVGPIANLKKIVVVKRLPKTRSGKTLRRILRTIANGEEYITPSTIEEPEVIAEIIESFKSQEITAYNHKK